jgi:hypothetical protein
MSNEVSNQPDKTSLVRALGPIDATMIVIGSMIGSGIFIVLAESSRSSAAPGWLVTGMGARRLADHDWGAVLPGVGNDDAARGRRLCFSTRGIRVSDRIFVWLDIVSRGANRDDCSGSDCVREVSRRLCHCSFTR